MSSTSIWFSIDFLNFSVNSSTCLSQSSCLSNNSCCFTLRSLAILTSCSFNGSLTRATRSFRICRLIFSCSLRRAITSSCSLKITSSDQDSNLSISNTIYSFVRSDKLSFNFVRFVSNSSATLASSVMLTGLYFQSTQYIYSFLKNELATGQFS